jgi:pyruvyl transferase EpsO
MGNEEKITQLGALLRRRLTPLLAGDCVLPDGPYYANVGDTLIWEGTRALVREAGGRLLAESSMSTWLFPRLDPRTVILLSGGGSLGDLWLRAQEFRLKVVEAYPDNPIVILPQSVHYDDAELMARDAEVMSRHRRLTICARDTQSESILRGNFGNEVVLLPDMAFCIPAAAPARDVHRHGTLLIKREDKEAAAADIPAGADIRDWPTMERTAPSLWLLYKLSGLCERGIMSSLTGRWADSLAVNTVRPHNIRAGVELLAPYEKVYSTRLHGAILSILTGRRETVIIDNSYGKNSAFYDTWLRDAEGVRLL